MAYKGRYTPRNPQKYLGDPGSIIFRSLWERKFMIYADANEDILEWGSEEIVIKYISPLDGRFHRYYCDFFVKAKTKTGEVKKYLIEIKPHKQTLPPIPPKRKTPKSSKRYAKEYATYMVNKAKFNAAETFCKEHGLEWLIVTERDLFAKDKNK